MKAQLSILAGESQVLKAQPGQLSDLTRVRLNNNNNNNSFSAEDQGSTLSSTKNQPTDQPKEAIYNICS